MEEVRLKGGSGGLDFWDSPSRNILEGRYQASIIDLDSLA